MRVIRLVCNNCGGALEVSKKARFVTCMFCNTALSIQKSEGAAYTETLEKIEERTETIAEDVETLKVQNELQRLDREWDNERQGLMMRNRNGHESVPTQVGAVLVLLFMAGMALAMFILAPQAGVPPAARSLISVFMLVFGVVMAVTMVSKAKRYQEARRRYEDRRRKFLSALADHRS